LVRLLGQREGEGEGHGGHEVSFTAQPSDELNIGSGSQGTSLFVEEILEDDATAGTRTFLAELGDLGELQSGTGRCLRMTVKNSFIELVEEPSPRERRRARSCDSTFLFPEDSVCVDANRASPAPSQAQGSDSVQSESLTVMLRNVPPLLARFHLLAMLDERGFCGRYDFVYLPVDFTHNLGLGYALVGFVDHASARIALESLQGLCFPAVDGSFQCEVSWSEPHRGLAGHIERYRNSPVMHPSMPDEYKPAIFVNGQRVPFPPPTKNIRPPRIRHPKVEGKAMVHPSPAN